MDELPPDARALLEAARAADEPTAAERERADASVRDALSAHGVHLPPLSMPGSPAADTGVRVSGPTAANTGLAIKLGLGAVALCASVWFGVRMLPREPRPEPPAPAEASTVRNAQPTAPVGPGPRAHDPEPAKPLPTAPPAPAIRHARAEPSRATAGESDIEVEVRMIAEADSLLRAGRSDAALHTLARHARRFPRSALREERDALRVLALCAEGPTPRAGRARERFLRAAPESVLVARVNAACAAPGAAP